jgi:hypothetical protein
MANWLTLRTSGPFHYSAMSFIICYHFGIQILINDISSLASASEKINLNMCQFVMSSPKRARKDDCQSYQHKLQAKSTIKDT